MEAVRQMIVLRSDRTRDAMMAKEDMENVSNQARLAAQAILADVADGIPISSGTLGAADGIERESEK